MATFEYEELQEKYDSFRHPVVEIEIGGKNISKDKEDLGITDIEVEMTCGFEASIASFKLGNCFNIGRSEFEMDKIKKYILLGSNVVIYVGYDTSVREVFRGFVAKVNFLFQKEDIPAVEVTAMDLKGIMMSGNYSRQILANTYSAAVNKILQEGYARLNAMGIVTAVHVSPTPDDPTALAMGGGSSVMSPSAAALSANPAPVAGTGTPKDKTIEMVYESDYEFVVKVAKKFNYEFFAIGGDVYFRKAKEDKSILIEIGPATGLHTIDVEYDVTGLVEKVEVRSVDPGKAQLLTVNQKSKNKISQGSRAKQLVKGTQKVYLDPTVSTKEDATYRANYLMEDMSYRFGTLTAEMIGIPEITPGKFIRVTHLGDAVSNLFYVVNVKHIMADDGYVTKITGKAATLDDGTGFGDLLGSALGGIAGGLI